LADLRCNKCQQPVYAKVLVSNLLASIGFKLYKTKVRGFIRELYGDQSTVGLESPYCTTCKKDLTENDMIGLCPITREFAPFAELVIIGVKREGSESIRKEVIHRKKCSDERIITHFIKYEYGKVRIVSESPMKLDWSLSDTA